jgi:hypothetical protein
VGEWSPAIDGRPVPHEETNDMTTLAPSTKTPGTPPARTDLVTRKAAALKAKIARNQLQALPVRPPTRARPLASQGPFSHLALHLQSLTATRKTREIGEKDDEIVLCGVAVAADLTTQVIGPVEVGRFAADGQVATFGPAIELATVGIAGPFPQSVGAVTMLFEDDGNGGPGKAADLLADAVEALKKELPAQPAARAAAPGGGGGVAEILQVIIDVFQLLGDSGILDGIKKKDEAFSQAVIKATAASASEPFAGGGALGPEQAMTYELEGPFRTSQYDARMRWVATP